MDFLAQDNCILLWKIHMLVLVEVVQLLSNDMLVMVNMLVLEMVMGMLELS